LGSVLGVVCGLILQLTVSMIFNIYHAAQLHGQVRLSWNGAPYAADAHFCRFAADAPIAEQE
jgi:hypothetical protein